MRSCNSEEKVISWSQKITDLHEQLFPNFELAEAMDLHNNYVGRILFQKSPGSYTRAIEVLKGKMKTAVFVTTLKEIETADFNLVFIEN